MKTGVPRVIGKPDGVRVQNTEFFNNVPAADAVANTLRYFNPTSLTWLGNIAKCYSKYRIHKLVFSYQSRVSTSTDGFLEMGTFYDVLDADTWAISYPDVLYACPQYATGPLYAGGALTSDNSKSNQIKDTNWFGVEVDVATAHRTYPWLLCNTATSTGQQANLNRAVSLATKAQGPAFAEPTAVGRIMATYDIEFIQPVAPVLNN